MFILYSFGSLDFIIKINRRSSRKACYLAESGYSDLVVIFFRLSRTSVNYAMPMHIARINIYGVIEYKIVLNEF